MVQPMLWALLCVTMRYVLNTEIPGDVSSKNVRRGSVEGRLYSVHVTLHTLHMGGCGCALRMVHETRHE